MDFVLVIFDVLYTMLLILGALAVATVVALTAWAGWLIRRAARVLHTHHVALRTGGVDAAVEALDALTARTAPQLREEAR